MTATKNLLSALARAIADMPDPKKNKKNDHFKNSYADLGAVLECIAEPLNTNGLVLTQTMTGDDKLVTTVWHCESGESLESVMSLRPEKATPQGMASAITYARRYAIKAMFGMSDVDDDGNKASGTKAAPAATSGAAKKAAHASQQTAAVDVFELCEEAVSAILAAPDEATLAKVGHRIAESKFAGEDHAKVSAAWKKRKAELKEVAK